MTVKRKPPNFLTRCLIEWHAGRIHDPIARLRYLQSRATPGSKLQHVRLTLKNVTVAPLLALALLGPSVRTGSDASEKPNLANRVTFRSLQQLELTPRSEVWAVEQRRDHEVYSNGLRIENRYQAPNYPRVYRVYPLGAKNGGTVDVRTEPAGIVFHTTESSQVPFEADHNVDLTRIGQGTLSHVSLNHCYHFVIDRFGRVFRIVPETDVAFHAGKSLWADQDAIYIGLNDSFLGVAFEGQTRDISEGAYLGAAQILSGKLLVRMLLDKYHIPVSHCITHSQVSVNPGNMRIGIHTDGAGDFPFEQLGLTDNYALPLPSIYLFGFDYDLVYLKSTGFRLWRGLFLADERVREEAMTRNLPVTMYKMVLRGNYRKIAAALDIKESTPEENE